MFLEKPMVSSHEAIKYGVAFDVREELIQVEHGETLVQVIINNTYYISLSTIFTDQVANAVAIVAFTNELGFVNVYYAKRIAEQNKENEPFKPLFECNFSNADDMKITNAKWAKDIRSIFSKLKLIQLSSLT